MPPTMFMNNAGEMPELSPLTPDFLAQLENLQLRSRAIADRVLSGEHHSRQRGASVDFAEHRPYSPGDDPRYLDWKLFGKRDRFHVRQFEQDSQLGVWCLLDLSPSMSFREPERVCSKFEYATWLGAALSWIALQQRDQVGLAVFAENGRIVCSPSELRGDPVELFRQWDTIQSLAPKNFPADQSAATLQNWPGLLQLAELVPQNSFVFVLTDGLGDPEALLRALSLIQSRRCDVHLLQVLDPAEVEFPFQEDVVLQDLESGDEQFVVSAAVRNSYQAEVHAFLENLQTEARRRGLRYDRQFTTDPLDRAILAILETK